MSDGQKRSPSKTTSFLPLGNTNSRPGKKDLRSTTDSAATSRVADKFISSCAVSGVRELHQARATSAVSEETSEQPLAPAGTTGQVKTKGTPAQQQKGQRCCLHHTQASQLKSQSKSSQLLLQS